MSANHTVRKPHGRQSTRSANHTVGKPRPCSAGRASRTSLRLAGGNYQHTRRVQGRQRNQAADFGSGVVRMLFRATRLWKPWPAGFSAPKRLPGTTFSQNAPKSPSLVDDNDSDNRAGSIDCAAQCEKLVQIGRFGSSSTVQAVGHRPADAQRTFQRFQPIRQPAVKMDRCP